MSFRRSMVTLLLTTSCNYSEVDRGRVYYQTSCTNCHNHNPKQEGVSAPELFGVSEQLLIDRVTNGYRGMPKQPSASKHVKELCAYLECS